MKHAFPVDVSPDWQALRDCIMRKGTPERVHYIELFLDEEIQAAICERYGLLKGVGPGDPFFAQKRDMAVNRFLGYDYVRCRLDDLEMPTNRMEIEDYAAPLPRESGRSFMEEHKGPITNWAEFEAYPWPDPDNASTRSLDWYSENLPEEMCIIAHGNFGHAAEFLTWLMGYETLCFSLYEQRDLVQAMADRLRGIFEKALRRTLAFDRVKLVWGSDDMGFKTGPLISPDDLREIVLPAHKMLAKMSHDAGRPYLLHTCGNVFSIMEDLIEDVRIDAKHSFEDTIESVIDDKKLYGDRIALLGGIDVDFLCRANQEQIRHRVRETLEACMPGGGYCLGTGNSVANYIPLDNYLTMLDEGRKFSTGAR